jgi:hypothetical protein
MERIYKVMDGISDDYNHWLILAVIFLLPSVICTWFKIKHQKEQKQWFYSGIAVVIIFLINLLLQGYLFEVLLIAINLSIFEWMIRFSKKKYFAMNSILYTIALLSFAFFSKITENI